MNRDYLTNNMSEIKKEHYDWFNKLPMEKVDTFNYQRTCPCGETVWYESDGLKVKSWILRHFNHKDENLSRKQFKYDWSIPWKFSYLGFKAFLQEFNLVDKHYEGNSEIFLDADQNKFVFDIVHEMKNEKFPVENHWVTFNPKESKINVR